MSKISGWLGIIALAGLSFANCNRSATQTASSPSKSGVLHVAIWSNYLSPELIKRFVDKTGIKIDTLFYSSNEELLAKVQAGAAGLDVAVPSDYMVTAMAQLGLIRELDKSRIPAAAKTDPRLQGRSFNPQGKYSVPLFWGTTGIAVNPSLFSGEIRGYRDLLTREDLAGKFSLLDDVREAIGAALKAEGLSLNTRKPEDLERAKKLLLKARPRIRAFTSDTQAPLASGELPVAHSYMTDALIARRKSGGKVKFIHPIEGGTLWVDNLVIPNGATHLSEAYQFINFILEESSLNHTAQAYFVAPANPAASAILPPELRMDPALVPSAERLKNHEMIEDLGENLALWDRIWTEVKASQ